MEQALEIIDYRLELDVHAVLRDDVMGKFPIVVEAALVLVILDLRTGDGDTGEMLDSACDAFAVGLGDVYQHAVHVEDDQLASHISSNAASRRRVCSRVPTVMRTQPGAS